MAEIAAVLRLSYIFMTCEITQCYFGLLEAYNFIGMPRGAQSSAHITTLRKLRSLQVAVSKPAHVSAASDDRMRWYSAKGL